MKRATRENGAIGGAEGLVFGVLIFVVGTLILLNAWAVVDAQLAANAAARESARAVTEARTLRDIERTAQLSANESLRSTWPRARNTTVTLRQDGASRGRCEMVHVIVSFDVPTISVPLINAAGGSRRVRSHHEEIIDPYRSGLPGSPVC